MNNAFEQLFVVFWKCINNPGGDTLSRDYILITPAKNEEKNLSGVADSVVEQTLKPKLWVIIDDGSVDNTSVIIETLINDYEWIKTVKLPPHPRDITFHYAYVCKKGFEYALQYARETSISYGYIGLLDADTILETAYFEKILQKFDQDKVLGIASGGIYLQNNGNLQWEKSSVHLPAGSGRIWAKACFLDTGGYALEPSPDSISNVKAILRGWRIQLFENIVAIQQRATSSANGLWKGYKINGQTAYYLNKHPLLVLLNVLFLSTQRPYFTGVPYLIGYFISFCTRKRQIDDKEIKDYFWGRRLKDVFKRVI